jgi:catechol 2,3-dioxygenase-like lactoylglutathione lyase family enzyme
VTGWRRPPEARLAPVVATVQVRYIVHDVDAAIEFYCRHLGFQEVMHPAPAFAMLARGDLRLVLSAPGGGPGGGQAMPDGRVPQPGGWNRFAVEVADVEAVAGELRRAGVAFRNEVVTGVGGKQVLIEDPSGNPVELFQPLLPEARLGQG